MASKLSGPIPQHPMFGGQNGYSRPAPRVKPEAESIASMHKGSVGNLLEVQGTGVGYYSSSQKQKSQPVNHLNANYKRMKQIQKACRQREQESNKPVKALWKSEKFSNVQSKVAENLQREPPPPRPGSANFLRAHSRTGSYSRISRSPSPCRKEPRPEKLTVPRASSAQDLRLVRNDFDFIKINGVQARHTQVKRAPSAMALSEVQRKKDEELQNYEKGQIPKYLQDRKKQWQRDEQERIANMPDPELPSGHKVMPDSERRETLELLKKNEGDLLRELQSLPIRSDTLRVKTRKQELEKKLNDIEEAKKIFSRRKVFIKIDE